jgi:hypothetical protein
MFTGEQCVYWCQHDHIEHGQEVLGGARGSVGHH